MKKLALLAIAFMMLGILPKNASAVTFANEVTSCVDIWAETKADGSGLLHFKGTDPKVISHYAAGGSEYAPDEDADGAVDKWYENGSFFQGDPNHAVVPIKKESLRMGLRGFNNIDANGKWGPLPHHYVRIHFGDNLIFQRSVDPSGSGSENGKGGNHITFIGDLSDQQAKRFVSVPYRGGSACGQEGVGVKSTPPAKHAHPRQKPKMKRVPCPSGKGICEEPCIVEMKEDIKEIKTDVKEIKKDVKDIKVIVTDTQKDVRVVKKDVKHVKKYVRKTYKKVKKIDKSLGSPKDGKTSLHEKVDNINVKVDQLLKKK